MVFLCGVNVYIHFLPIFSELPSSLSVSPTRVPFFGRSGYLERCFLRNTVLIAVSLSEFTFQNTMFFSKCRKILPKKGKKAISGSKNGDQVQSPRFHPQEISCFLKTHLFSFYFRRNGFHR